eukprot:15365185-Ditylum_brightwellii.AAC.1
MLLQRAWNEVFNALHENEQGNRNISAFSLALQANKSLNAKIQSLAEDIGIVFLVADEDKKIAILHGPKNVGGMRTRPSNKVAAMVGLGPMAIRVLINEKMALENCKLVTPTIKEFEACTTTRKKNICL